MIRYFYEQYFRPSNTKQESINYDKLQHGPNIAESDLIGYKKIKCIGLNNDTTLDQDLAVAKVIIPKGATIIKPDPYDGDTLKTNVYTIDEIYNLNGQIIQADKYY